MGSMDKPVCASCAPCMVSPYFLRNNSPNLKTEQDLLKNSLFNDYSPCI